jgi:hypothetical protein
MTDTMPPITLEEMRAIIANPNFKTYLVLGETGDKAWRLAIAAQNTLAGIQSYLVSASEQPGVQTAYNVAPNGVGLVFGHGAQLITTLTKKQAEDYLTLCETLKAAP